MSKNRKKRNKRKQNRDTYKNLKSEEVVEELGAVITAETDIKDKKEIIIPPDSVIKLGWCAEKNMNISSIPWTGSVDA